MSLFIFLKYFKTGILLASLFLVGVSGDCGLDEGVVDSVVKVFSKATNCERLVNLFADENYRKENCPEELCNVQFGPKTAIKLFDELLAVFTFAPAEMPLKKATNMNRYRINVNKTQVEVVKKVAQDIIEKVLKNEDPAVKGPEIFGEVALRVGADLTRAFYFVIGADYKRVWDMSRPDFQKEFSEIVGDIKDTLTDAEKSKKIESARTKILEKKVKHFETMWNKVDSIEKTIYLEKNRVLILAAREKVAKKMPKVDEKRDEKDRRAHEQTAKDSRMKH